MNKVFQILTLLIVGAQLHAAPAGRSVQTLLRERTNVQVIPTGMGSDTYYLALNNEGLDTLHGLQNVEDVQEVTDANFSNNNLQEIPESISQLSQLEFLDISGNSNLQRLPDEALSNLQNLQEVVLDAAVAQKQGIADVLESLKDRGVKITLK